MEEGSGLHGMAAMAGILEPPQEELRVEHKATWPEAQEENPPKPEDIITDTMKEEAELHEWPICPTCGIRHMLGSCKDPSLDMGVGTIVARSQSLYKLGSTNQYNHQPLSPQVGRHPTMTRSGWTSPSTRRG
jgi:hypothetical protein